MQAIPEQSVNEGELLALTVPATDPDLPAQRLTFTLGAGAADGASVNPTNGLFTWTPTEAQGPNSYFFRVIVTDDGSSAQSEAQNFSVVVREVNRAPELPVIPDQTVNEGVSVEFSVFGSDADVPTQTLNYRLGAGAPDGASLSEGGFFFWTPDEAQGPGTNRITIMVTDSGTPSLSATQRFTVFVREVNHAPALGALADQAVNEGELVSFTARASDTDLPAQNLVFTLGAGAPAGASIDPQTGAFTWMPSQAHASTTNRISVVVTDGSLTASQSFTVVVSSGTLTPPRLLNPRFTANIFSASVDSLAGRRYFLERNVFFAPSEWQTVGEFQGSGGLMLLTDPTATNAHCFYRARVQ